MLIADDRSRNAMTEYCETTGHAACSLPAKRNLLGGVTAVLMLTDGPQEAAAGGIIGARRSAERQDAPDLALAFQRCIGHRLAAAGRLVVAAPTDSDVSQLAASLETDPDDIIAQGEGSIGERIGRVWRHIGIATPIAFFTGRGPDLPDFALARISAELRRVDAAIGPTHDGGFWTLAARRYRPWLIHDIDWGRSSVYDAICRRAAEADIELAVLPLWPTTERLSDLPGLRSRLAMMMAQAPTEGHGLACSASLDALRELAQSLDRLALSSPALARTLTPAPGPARGRPRDERS
jgi:glycosyltransferase A (GT-A) superfamily protein (DUF2064 family)